MIGHWLCCGKRSTTTLVGDPADQCYRYILRDRNIKGGVHRAGTSRLGGNDECVALQSASVEDGEATWIICCIKDETGRCKNCTALLELQVFEADDRSKIVARKRVTVECASGP